MEDAPGSLPDTFTHHRDVQALRKAIEWRDPVYFIGFVYSSSPDIIENLRRCLSDRIKTTQTVHPDHDDPDQFLKTLNARAKLCPEKQDAFIVDMRRDKNTDPASYSRMANALQYARNSLCGEENRFVLLVVLNPNDGPNFYKLAPDFCSVRTGTFEIPDDVATSSHPPRLPEP